MRLEDSLDFLHCQLAYALGVLKPVMDLIEFTIISFEDFDRLSKCIASLCIL